MVVFIAIMACNLRQIASLLRAQLDPSSGAPVNLIWTVREP